MTETEIANLSLIKAGGAGDQAAGSGMISDINDTDQISSICRTLLPICRRKAIIDLAMAKSPFRESIRYKDLGTALADASLPEIGSWSYAYNLPTDAIAVFRQIDEAYQSDSTSDMVEYRFTTIANKAGTGSLFLTNNLSNADGDSAFIEYVIDVINPNVWSESLRNCVVTLLAAEACPMIGKKAEQRTTLLAEYKQLTAPEAKKFNASMLNNHAAVIPDYKGGRS
ncbi:MAG: hypothetical protein WCY05_08085 [Candidatus Omnitrophota bacterium]